MGYLYQMGRQLRRFGAIGLTSATAAALLVGCGADRGGDQAFPTNVADQIDRIVRPRMDAGLVPGALVAVIDPERGTLTRAYGTADLASGRPMDVADHVRIGSVTKTFTATAVLRAADEGKLSLDDVLERYVPGVPNGNTITLRDLLGMRGGVWNLDGDPAFAEQVISKAPTAEWHEGDRLRAIIAHPEKATPPRTETTYSNSEFYLLGLVLERVFGKPVHEVVNDVVAAHGLDNTTYPTDASLPVPESRGYSYFDEAPTDVTRRNTPAIFGAAGTMVSTISDLAEYAGLLGRGDLLKPETFQSRTQFTGDLHYGLGLAQFGQWIGHNGAVLGYNTQMGYLPEKNVRLAVAVNQYTTPPDLLGAVAATIWFAVIRQLYPGTVPDGQTNAPPNPPVPTVAELDSQLQRALDPAVPASEKALRVAGDDKDPELLTRLASALARYSVTTRVNRVTELGPGQLLATTTVTGPNGVRPMILPFVVRDSSWRIDTSWACANLADRTSAACV